MKRAALVLSLLLAMSLPLAAGAQSTAAVGAEGTLYVVQQGRYGDLFPKGSEAEKDNPVLALDVQAVGEKTSRRLVAGTEGPELESAPALTVDRVSETAYLVWEARKSIHSQLYIAGYDGESWSEVVEFSGNPYSSKSRPDVAVTHHRSLSFDGGGAEAEIKVKSRTILHLVWWDEGPGNPAALYTPLVLQDGELVGFNPVFRLTDLIDPRDGEIVGHVPPQELLTTPTVEPGRDGESVAVAFTSLASNEVVGLEIRVLPSDLVEVADRGRAHVILVGSTAQGRAELVAAVKIQLATDGSRLLDPELAAYIAERLAQLLTDAEPGEELVALAERGRAHVILVGSRLMIRDTNLQDPSATRVIEFDGADGSTQALLFRTAARRPVPRLPSVPLSVFLSRDAAELILAWDVQDGVRYIESAEPGWVPRLTLSATNEIGRARAYEVLEQRVRP